MGILRTVAGRGGPRRASAGRARRPGPSPQLSVSWSFPRRQRDNLRRVAPRIGAGCGLGERGPGREGRPAARPVRAGANGRAHDGRASIEPICLCRPEMRAGTGRGANPRAAGRGSVGRGRGQLGPGDRERGLLPEQPHRRRSGRSLRSRRSAASALHVGDHVIAEFGALDFGRAFHEAREIIRDAFAGDGAVQAFHDQVRTSRSS